jgi:hypothetical protein
LQHQAGLTAQIVTLQGELHIAVAAAESRTVVLAERDASIVLGTMLLKTALEN